MFSISPAEFLTIAVVALLIFGPRRLGEIARQAGKWTGELRRTADELRSSIQTELDAVTKPVTDLKTDLAAAGKGLVESADGELRWVEVDDKKMKPVSRGGPGDVAAEDEADAAAATGVAPVAAPGEEVAAAPDVAAEAREAEGGDAVGDAVGEPGSEEGDRTGT